MACFQYACLIATGLAVGSANLRRRKGSSVQGRGGGLVLWLLDGGDDNREAARSSARRSKVLFGKEDCFGGLGANVGWFKVQQNPSLGCQDMGRWTVITIFLLIFVVITWLCSLSMG
jgi:hypothetical protein